MKVITDYKRVIEVSLEGAGISESDRELIRPEMKDRIDRVLITGALIQKRVQALAKQIAEFYQGRKKIDLVFILEGARVFASDLEREIYNVGGPEIRTQSIKAQTYGAEIKQEGEQERKVKIIYAPRKLEGKEVLLVEDIVDQGFTLKAIQDWLIKEAGVRDLKTCVLVAKRLENPTEQVRALRENLKLDWVGFTIPDRWIAGYGIDAGEDFRFLPFIVVVKEDYYLKSSQ